MKEDAIKRLNSNVRMQKELGSYVAYYSKQAITINTHIAEFRKAKKKAKRLCKEFGFTSGMLKGSLAEGRKAK